MIKLSIPLLTVILLALPWMSLPASGQDAPSAAAGDAAPAPDVSAAPAPDDPAAPAPDGPKGAGNALSGESPQADQTLQSGAPAPAEGAAEGEEAVTAPKISFDAMEFDGGASPAGTTIAHDFTMTNEGDDALLIYEVVPGCGCTVVSFDKFIPPGKSGKVTVNVDLYREWAGQNYVKSVTVLSNDPERPRLRLLMRGEIGAPEGETLNRVTPPLEAAGEAGSAALPVSN
ncbi:MAG: DUF1573 domain-containing protein [Deltaproteobacteria bacterium]|jgi:hypothetical protein|nr:DUF1573 domain-containing protein [Deltaproteobacteria bacterium]